jgi:hypothetical protein
MEFKPLSENPSISAFFMINMAAVRLLNARVIFKQLTAAAYNLPRPSFAHTSVQSGIITANLTKILL